MKGRRLCCAFACVVLTSASLIVFPGCKAIEELPARKIRQRFKELAGRELPQKTEGLRGFYAHLRDPEIFVRFETDSEGIAEVLETFGGPDVESRTYDATDMRNMKVLGASLFPRPSLWQQETGLKIFDQESIQSGRKLTYMAPRFGEVGYEVFIDDERDMVYIQAYVH